jgi:hypothetical protein
MFYVINEEGLPSFNDDEAESFASRGDAEKRAIELAEECPGQTYLIAQVIAEVVTPVGDAEVTDVA